MAIILFLIPLRPSKVFAQSPIPFTCGSPPGDTLPESLPRENAYCDEPGKIKYIAVNYHFIQDENGGHNFSETEDGYGNSGINGYEWAAMMIGQTNDQLSKNLQMWRPSGNSTQVLPIPFRFVLKDVFFHQDAQYWESSMTNIYSIHSLYKENDSDRLNTYDFLSTDYSGIATYTGGYSGVDGWVIYGQYPLYPLYQGGNLAHEYGHNLNLRHTWNLDDLCDDTPKGVLYNGENVQCYGHCDNGCSSLPPPSGSCAETEPWCCDWANVSNNMMDYNGYLPHAVTPCQIDRTEAALLSTQNDRIDECMDCPSPIPYFKALEWCSYCDYDHRYKYSNQICPGQLILDGRSTADESKYQVEICEFNIATQQCVNTPVASSWIDGDVQFINLGDLFPFYFKPSALGKTHKIILRADNECGPVGQFSKLVYVTNSPCDVIGVPTEPVDIAANPNPFTGGGTVDITRQIDGQCQVDITDYSGQVVQNLQPSLWMASGQTSYTFTLSTSPPGLYPVRVLLGSQVFYHMMIKLP